MKGIDLVKAILDKRLLDSEIFVAGTEVDESDDNRTEVTDVQSFYNEEEETQEGIILIDGYIES